MISAVVKATGRSAFVAITAAISALHFCQPHTKIGILQAPFRSVRYQNCPVLPKMFISCSVAPRLPPDVPVFEPEKRERVSQAGRVVIARGADLLREAPLH